MSFTSNEEAVKCNDKTKIKYSTTEKAPVAKKKKLPKEKMLKITHCSRPGNRRSSFKPTHQNAY